MKKTFNVSPARTILIKEKQGRGTVYLVLARSSLLCLGLFLKTVSVSLEIFFSDCPLGTVLFKMFCPFLLTLL